MKSWMFLLAGLATFGPSEASAAQTVRRLALVVGANAAEGRPTLRYAVADAARFASVLRDLGGVQPRDVKEIPEPTPSSLEEAVRGLGDAVRLARSEAARVEVVFYYSGHANETGLLLGNQAYSYQDLRDQLASVNADVRIVVLDACGSGAMTRLKGGSPRRPFLVDMSSNMKGHALLTSSSADEVAQESDRIGGSFFTHYLVSGLRGAADSSGEGKVTLNEAYQYAFNETLGRTLKTQGGPQHPSYDIDLSGTGDVVITDLRETSSSLVLSEDISGRCYVREQKAGIVIEVEKPAGRRIELGVGPGRYEVHCQGGNSARSSQFKAEDGASRVLNQSDFSNAKLDPTLRRGGVDLRGRVGMEGVHRLVLEGSISSRGTYRYSYFTGNPPSESINGSSQSGMIANLTLTHWIKPRIGIEMRVRSRELYNQSARGEVPSWYDRTFATGVLVGARFELNGSSKVSAPRPFLHAAIGPFFRPASSFPIDPRATPEQGSQKGLGASLGGGIDIRFGSHLGLGFRSSYDLVPEFKDSAGNTLRYGGWKTTLTTSWFFGGGRTKN